MERVAVAGLARFEILSCIGEGVSAKVYTARDRNTDSIVAIKILKPHLQTDPVSLERFRREVFITRALQHPQIVPMYDLVRADDATCTGEWFQLQAVESYGPAAVVWACSRTKDEVFLEVRPA